MIQETYLLRGLRWSYVPLLISGVAPFWVGTLLASVNGYPLRGSVASLATLGVILLILAALWIGELYDLAAPGQPHNMESVSRPSDVPGWLRGTASAATLKKMVCSVVAAATAVGWVLQFYFHTGNLTIPLGGFGLLGAYAFSAPPFYWRFRGMGEIVAGLWFGLLPLITGFYLQSGGWASELGLFGLPLVFSSFNVFLTQGFQGYAVDVQTGQQTLMVRLGPIGGALVYTIANIVMIMGLVGCLLFPASPLPYHQGLWVIILLAVINQEMIKRKQYRQSRGQIILQLMTFLVNLGLGIWLLVMSLARL